ncbi:MAG: bifunctional UDP-N-acetylglucosamine diphosphorylase/glucosamine-1-phosphate N-acetyltransferase GlmU [Chloroflexi bacterium]|nr:bifunctional UDP-N-acetylglucosamine diphosphorylase/glucosamine-1-phosphate N-acetyltransferase GlmU [Chloroflexota bacterium]
MSGELGVIVLAAGKGTRMKSALPKVLHPVCGKPMLLHILDAARELAPARLAVVIGHEAGQVLAAMQGEEDLTFVVQSELLGTADAVRRCREAMTGCRRVMVLNADSPMVTGELLRALEVSLEDAPMSFVTCQVPDAAALGRVGRDAGGAVTGIVEAAEWTGAPGSGEINAGLYVFDGAWLWAHIEGITKSPAGEYYLTDLPGVASAEGRPARTCAAAAEEVLFVDDRVRLAEAERLMRERILRRHMLAGVTIADPATTYIDASVRLAQDVTVLPNCYLYGQTDVFAGAVIGPGTTLRNAVIGVDSRIQASVVEESRVGSRVRMGPFAHLRQNAVIGDDCEIGNYAEVKNANLGNNVKMHHFSCVLDADVGDRTNIAAGIITCNFDGVKKNRTTIGSDVFIGSDTMLVAPVTLGDGSRTGAGSVVTKDIPAGASAYGVPARIVSQPESGAE